MQSFFFSLNDKHIHAVSCLLAGLLHKKFVRVRLRRGLFRCFVEFDDHTEVSLLNFINQLPSGGRNRLRWILPKRIFRRLFDMSGISRTGGDSGHFELTITWEPHDYNVSVKIVSPTVLELGFAVIPGTERKTEADRQEIVRRLMPLIESNQVGSE